MFLISSEIKQNLVFLISSEMKTVVFFNMFLIETGVIVFFISTDSLHDNCLQVAIRN